MSDQDALRDRIAKVIYATLSGQYGDFGMPDDAAQAVIDELGLAVAEQDPHWRHDCWLDTSTDQGHQTCEGKPLVRQSRAVGAWQEVSRG